MAGGYHSDRKVLEGVAHLRTGAGKQEMHAEASMEGSVPAQSQGLCGKCPRGPRNRKIKQGWPCSPMLSMALYCVLLAVRGPRRAGVGRKVCSPLCKTMEVGVGGFAELGVQRCVEHAFLPQPMSLFVSLGATHILHWTVHQSKLFLSKCAAASTRPAKCYGD